MINSKVVNTINPNRTEFPKLMISASNTVVLFTNETSGVVVRPGLVAYGIGHSSESWSTHTFTNFNGKVELSNV